MKDIPRITIITPSLNQGSYIEQTIKSVLDQGYPDLEYIVIDGGSTDGTLDILRNYEGRLTWISEKDAGQSDAINKGIRMATGDIIAYLNSDDLYEDGALNSVAERFLSDPSLKWLTGRCRIIDENGGEVRKPITAYKNFLLKRYSFNVLLITNPISQPATFWRREVMDEIGLFDVHEHLAMDYDYWLRLGQKYDPCIVDRYLASFRVYRQSKTSSNFTRTFKREMILAKKYSRSNMVHILHWLSGSAISAVYTVLNGLSFLKRQGSANK